MQKNCETVPFNLLYTKWCRWWWWGYYCFLKKRAYQKWSWVFTFSLIFFFHWLTVTSLGLVPQKMVKFNPGLSQILSKVFLSKNM